MLYDIRLRIGHRYGGRAGGGRHLLRVVPADLPGRQRLHGHQLAVSPAGEEYTSRKDFFGNAMTLVVHDAPHGEMDIVLRARVACQPIMGDLDIAPPLEELPRQIDAVCSLAPDAPHHFLGPSPRIVSSRAMSEYARALVSPGMTARDAVREIGLALHRDLIFDAEATSVDTPARDAFERRRGVCQDFTHIMITCLREIGVPAGYVSGYLRTVPPEGQPRLEGADAMHAWVRAWCGRETGWVEFDPTNAIGVGVDHILVAVGRDYSDIAPVRGILRTSGENDATQAVDVVPVPREGVHA